MKLIIEPPIALPALQEDLELVVVYRDSGVPEVFTPPGVPRPDRHLLLGVVQSIAFAIQEMDPESVVIAANRRVALDLDGTVKGLDPELLIVRTLDCRLGALVRGNSDDARRLARAAVRSFTAAVRLDVP